MSRLPTPDRGQPIDVPYLYQVATAINSLADQIDASAERYTTIFNRETGPQDLRTSNARFLLLAKSFFLRQKLLLVNSKNLLLQWKASSFLL
jgi:hypothetical protein